MKDLLTEEIRSEFTGLAEMQLGAGDYSATVTGVAKLMEKAVELEKFEAERKDKLDEQRRNEELDAVKRELDEQERENRLYLQEKQLEFQQRQIELQEQQHKQTKKGNTIQTLVTVGTALLAAGVTVWGTIVTLDFEKDWTITTSAGKGFLGRLFTKK